MIHIRVFYHALAVNIDENPTYGKFDCDYS